MKRSLFVSVNNLSDPTSGNITCGSGRGGAAGQRAAGRDADVFVRLGYKHLSCPP